MFLLIIDNEIWFKRTMQLKSWFDNKKFYKFSIVSKIFILDCFCEYLNSCIIKFKCIFVKVLIWNVFRKLFVKSFNRINTLFVIIARMK